MNAYEMSRYIEGLLADAASAETPEESDALLEALYAWAEGPDGVGDKIQRLRYVRRSVEARVSALKAEAARFNEAAARENKALARVSLAAEVLARTAREAGVQVILDDGKKVSWRRSDSVHVPEAAEQLLAAQAEQAERLIGTGIGIPVRVRVEVDKTAAKAELKAGVRLPLVTLEEKESLQW